MLMKRFLLFVSILFFSSVTKSQSQKIDAGWCSTGMSQIPSELAKQKKAVSNPNTTQNLIDPNELIIIPVVFHVLYKNSDENIAISTLNSQIERLNTDFGNRNSETQPSTNQVPTPWLNLPADIKIQFRLACVDPYGNTTNGIEKRLTPNQTFNHEFYYDAKMYIHGGLDAWPTEKYLNIWVCDIEDQLGNSTLPWEYYNTTTNGIPISILDGIILDYTVVGDPGLHSTQNKGRSAVHEVGHWLGLYHVDEGTACSTPGDEVYDTPTQNIAHIGTCPTFPSVSCNNEPNGDMFMNYMDQTADACMFMFTQGQKTRMRSFFSSNGPFGTRYPFLANYFSIKEFTTNPVQFCNLITVDINNPACYDEPVIYTVLTGPVTIYQSDNFHVVLKAQTGITSGSVTVRADCGNYRDEYTFNFQLTVPDPVILNPQSGGVAIQEVVAGQTYTCSVTNIPGTTFTWSIESYYPGAVITSGQGTSTITFIPNQCNISRLNQQNRGPYEKDYNTELELCNLTVRVQASVGLCQSLSSAIIFNYAGCGVGNQPCCSYPGQTCCIDCLTQLYPNPTRNSITVESGEKIYTAKITDATGLLYKSIDFKSGAKKFDININELREGLYFINLYDGKNWISRSFQIARQILQNRM